VWCLWPQGSAGIKPGTLSHLRAFAATTLPKALGSLLPPSPPAEEANACQDQAGGQHRRWGLGPWKQSQRAQKNWLWMWIVGKEDPRKWECLVEK
jgi:hypothetical protein